MMVVLTIASGGTVMHAGQSLLCDRHGAPNGAPVVPFCSYGADNLASTRAIPANRTVPVWITQWRF